MGSPRSELRFGVRTRSADNRLYARWPLGDKPIPVGAGVTAVGSAASGSASGGGGGGSNRLKGDEYLAMRTDLVDGTGLYGFTQGLGSSVTRSRLATGGPANRPYIHHVMVANFETGNNWNKPSGNGSTYGQSLFWRFSFRQGSANGAQKIIIIDPELSPNSRPIMVIQPWGGGGGNSGFVFRVCINGGIHCQDDGGFWDVDHPDGPQWRTGSSFNLLNTWYNVQVECRYPTNASASNGYWKVWTNNDNYAAPTAETPAVIPLRNDGNGTDDLNFSGYLQTPGIFTGRTWDTADFRSGPTFDSNWHASGS